MRDIELSTHDFEALVEMANRSPKVRDILAAAGMWGDDISNRDRVQYLLHMTRSRGALRAVNDTIDELMELAANGERMKNGAVVEDHLSQTLDENARLRAELAVARGDKKLTALPTGTDS